MSEKITQIFKTINNELIFGECHGTETGILIVKPMTSFNNNVIPYLLDAAGSPAPQINLNSMNIVWTAPLSDFPQLENIYNEYVGGLIKEPKKQVIV